MNGTNHFPLASLCEKFNINSEVKIINFYLIAKYMNEGSNCKNLQ